MTTWLYMVHGEVKLRREGLRTRDAHITEWLMRRGDDQYVVVSRPEPWPMVSMARRSTSPVDAWQRNSRQVLRVPPLRDRRLWWVRTAGLTPAPDEGARRVLTWNPFSGDAVLGRGARDRVVCFDFLDDWLVHPAYKHMTTELTEAYRAMCDSASVVTANSEATRALAQRMGRSDCHLILNGCDPERFHLPSSAVGPTKIGYAGKISERLDVDLIRRLATSLRGSAELVVAGPVIDGTVGDALASIEGVRMIGDVHYEQYPALLASWDIGIVPHRVGPGETGGDVMKIYEYRAAGLPSVMTPIIGHERALEGVAVADRDDFVDAVADVLATRDGARVRRAPGTIAREQTWAHKAEQFRTLLEAS